MTMPRNSLLKEEEISPAANRNIYILSQSSAADVREHYRVAFDGVWMSTDLSQCEVAFIANLSRNE